MKWLELDEVWSTQDEAARLITGPDCPDVVFAHHQTGGRGRFGRAWHSSRGDSLTVSVILHDAADHHRPWLCGMAVAVAVAEVLGCRVRWPNDLTLNGKKLGGILTEVRTDDHGRRVPILGIGVNLNQTSFPPEIEETATSLAAEGRPQRDALELAHEVIGRALAPGWPTEWAQVAGPWSNVDETVGKVYIASGGQTIVATGIGPQGELVGSSGGLQATVMAAEAVFGKTED